MNAAGQLHTQTDDPTAKARFEAALASILPDAAALPLANCHLIGPFDNADLVGLFTAYPPESGADLAAVYPAKHGEARWTRASGLDGAHETAIPLDPLVAAEFDSIVYCHAEARVEARTLARISVESTGFARVWVNGALLIAPTIPEPANPRDHAAWAVLEPGANQVLVKLAFMRSAQTCGICVRAFGDPQAAMQAAEGLAGAAADPGIRLSALMTLAEWRAAAGQTAQCRETLCRVWHDPYATRWDAVWADAVEQQFAETGRFAPFHDVAAQYQPVTEVHPLPEFWPQSAAPSRELLVVDVSDAAPQVEFALSVLQGLVNRAQPRLYLLHSRYSRQDRQWLDELHSEGYAWRPITIDDAWRLFQSDARGAAIYDGAIMDEIGAPHSDRLNQTNVLAMVCALNDAVPLTPEMNQARGLPVVFDARGKWSGQYDMMRWAYQELFPRMNPRLLATNYPGIFLLTDYLVCHRVFTFWFPEFRTTPEENLLRGILASTPPNSPILGWWFDWMPNPKDPRRQQADAVMESSGLLRGSYFGKILTPSHEATNLSVHSGVAPGGYRHKAPARPAFDPAKVYYTFMISDGDNLGEALMMRTRDLHWDKPERGQFPMGWSFAPATARLAPAVLSYYLRTATPNDVLMGGLGAGYTEPMIYLRAYPEQREALWAHYARETDRAIGWIDSPLLWLIDGRHEEEDRYARGSSGQLRGIYTGYGGAPDLAEARVTHNRVVAFRSATRFHGEPQTREEKIQAMVDEIRQGARSRPDFVEAWVLNWGLEMSVLQEVQARLGPDYVCVRPDVLAEMRLRAAQ
jgi:hypothetical protein